MTISELIKLSCKRRLSDGVLHPLYAMKILLYTPLNSIDQLFIHAHKKMKHFPRIAQFVVQFPQIHILSVIAMWGQIHCAHSIGEGPGCP